MINSKKIRGVTTLVFISTCIYTLYRAVVLHHTATYIDVLFTITHSFWLCTIFTTTTTKNYRYNAILLTIATLLIIFTINDIESTAQFMGKPSFEYLLKDTVYINNWKIVPGLPDNVFNLLSTYQLYQITLKVEFVMMMLLFLIGTLKRQKVHKYMKINKRKQK